MNLTGNTVLITGGGTGIGLAFAERFIKAGNRVIICGRRESVLQKAKDKFPSLVTRVCDLTVEKERIALYDWVVKNYPEVNVLVNNAGILQRVNVLQADTKNDWQNYSREIAINLEAPIHLSMLFAKFFIVKDNAAIINISSGLAFTPLAFTPIYSATKSALHSFTVCLRYQLSTTQVKVIEIVPPAIDTDLNGAWLRTQIEPLDAFSDSVFEKLLEGNSEIGYSTSVERMQMSRNKIDEYTEKMYNAMKDNLV